MRCDEVVPCAGHLLGVGRRGEQPFADEVERHLAGCRPCCDAVVLERWRRFRRRPGPLALLAAWRDAWQVRQRFSADGYVEEDDPLSRIVAAIVLRARSEEVEEVRLRPVQGGPAAVLAADAATRPVEEAAGRQDEAPLARIRHDAAALLEHDVAFPDAEGAGAHYQLRVLFVTDGVEREAMTLPSYILGPLRARVKSTAGMSLLQGEPQRGLGSLRAGGAVVDLAVETSQTADGEELRILLAGRADAAA